MNSTGATIFDSTIFEIIPAKEPLTRIHMSIPRCDRLHIPADVINRITRSTGTSISVTHYLPQEKVEICGPIARLEEAREALRMATPFVISFDMYITRGIHSLPQMEYIKKLESRHNVKVAFFETGVRGICQVLVQGTVDEARKVKEAVEKLSTSTVGYLHRPVFRLVMSVCKDVRDVFTKNDSAIIRTAMANTDTDIDIMSVQSDGSYKVIISGSVRDIHNAKRELVGFIPIELTFEIPHGSVDHKEMMSLAEKHDLHMSIQQSKDIKAQSITLRGTERYVENIYDAYKEVRCLEEQDDWSSSKQDENLRRLLEGDQEFSLDQYRESVDWLQAEFHRASIESERNYLC